MCEDLNMGSDRGNKYYYCYSETPSGPLVPLGTAGDLGEIFKEVRKKKSWEWWGRCES